jgi:hypothetical protein
LLALQST